MQDLNLLVLYWFYLYFVLYIQQTGGWFIVQIYQSHKVPFFQFKLFFSFFFYSSAAWRIPFFWSTRVALWTGRQLFKQRTKVQALLLASIRLTEVSVSKNAESLPVGTWLSALTSPWEDKQSTRTMINERSNYYLISAIEAGVKFCHLEFMFVTFKFRSFFKNPFFLSAEQTFLYLSP